MGDLKEAPSFVSALAVVNKWKIVISASPNKEIFKKKKIDMMSPSKKSWGPLLTGGILYLNGKHIKEV